MGKRRKNRMNTVWKAMKQGTLQGFEGPLSERVQLGSQ